MVLELYNRHPRLVATLIMIDTYGGCKGSLPADEVQARVAGARLMLAAPMGEADPTLPGLLPASRRRTSPCARRYGRRRPPTTLGLELALMAETDLSDLLPQVAVPTLLLWGTQCSLTAPAHRWPSPASSRRPSLTHNSS